VFQEAISALREMILAQYAHEFSWQQSCP
jgi:hypothetical protein